MGGDRVEDFDKDRDCYDEQIMEDEVFFEVIREQLYLLSEEKLEICEGMQGRRNLVKFQKQKIMFLVIEFEFFIMVFDGDIKFLVFFEVQEMEDEDDLFILDSCSVIFSSVDGKIRIKSYISLIFKNEKIVYIIIRICKGLNYVDFIGIFC